MVQAQKDLVDPFPPVETKVFRGCDRTVRAGLDQALRVPLNALLRVAGRPLVVPVTDPWSGGDPWEEHGSPPLVGLLRAIARGDQCPPAACWRRDSDRESIAVHATAGRVGH